MKRLDLIRELERGGCVFLRHGGGMTGIRIRAPKFASPCLGIAKSRNIWPLIFCER